MHRWPPETGVEVCGMWISSHKLRLRRWCLNWNGSLQRSRNMTDLFWMFFWNMRTRIKMLVVQQTQEILLFLCSCKGPWSLFSFTSHLATNYMRFCAWGQDMDCLQVATKSVEFDKFTRWLIVPWASSANPFFHGNSKYQEDLRKIAIPRQAFGDFRVSMKIWCNSMPASMAWCTLSLYSLSPCIAWTDMLKET